MTTTRITPKYQTTIPQEIRTALDVGQGSEVQWHLLKGMVVVEANKKIKDPVKFLTSHGSMDLDVVKLVKEVREER